MSKESFSKPDEMLPQAGARPLLPLPDYPSKRRIQTTLESRKKRPQQKLLNKFMKEKETRICSKKREQAKTEHRPPELSTLNGPLILSAQIRREPLTTKAS